MMRHNSRQGFFWGRSTHSPNPLGLFPASGWKVRTHFNYSCLTAGLTVVALLCTSHSRPCFETRPAAYLSQVFLCIAAGQQNISAASVAQSLSRSSVAPGPFSPAQPGVPEPRCPVLRTADGSAAASSKSLELMPHKVSFRLARGPSVLCFVINTNTHTRTLAHAHCGRRTNTWPDCRVSAVHAPTHTHTHMAKGNKNKQALIFTIIENRAYRDVPMINATYGLKLSVH